MEEMRILFVVNPISGRGKGRKFLSKVTSMSQYKQIKYDIRYTEYKGHAAEIIKQVRQSGEYTHVVAVGGDGTVNEVGVALIGSSIKFGIIPLGSGNGFARHVGYSLFVKKALRQLLHSHIDNVDVLNINGVYSLNVSGVGFDAQIAYDFNRMQSRGLFSYIYVGIKKWFNYKEREYQVICDGQTIKVKCFVLSIANTSQYGNNVNIAPHASLLDGKMDVCFLNRPPIWGLLKVVLCLLTGEMHYLHYYKDVQCEKVEINGEIQYVHIDGESIEMHPPLHINVEPGILKVIVPDC